MRSLKHFLFLVVIGGIFFLLTSLAQGAEFTAKVTNVYPGGKETGKIYVKGNKQRIETKEEKLHIHVIAIYHLDKNKGWIISPQHKSYTEMPWFKRNVKMMPYTSEQAKAKMKKIGTETVNGYECDKFEYKGLMGKTEQIWIAKKLGIPIKKVALDGSFSQEFKDIKPEKLDDSLFEIPPGYQKFNFP